MVVVAFADGVDFVACLVLVQRFFLDNAYVIGLFSRLNCIGGFLEKFWQLDSLCRIPFRRPWSRNHKKEE